MKVLRGPCLCPLVDGPHPDTRHPRSPSSLQMESPSLRALAALERGFLLRLAPRAQPPPNTQKAPQKPPKEALRGFAAPAIHPGMGSGAKPQVPIKEGGSTAEAPPAADEARRVLAQRSNFHKGAPAARWENWLSARGKHSDRVLRTKQGAVFGAALRFSQAPAAARRKNRLSARGWAFR